MRKEEPESFRVPPCRETPLRRVKCWSTVYSGEPGQVASHTPVAVRPLCRRRGAGKSISPQTSEWLFRPLFGMAAILDHELPEGISLFDLAVDVPAGWNEQRLRIDYAWSEQNKQSCHQPPFGPVDGRLPTHSGQWAFLSDRHVSPRKRTSGLEDRDTDSNSGTMGTGIEHV